MSNENVKPMTEWLRDPEVTGDIKHIAEHLLKVYERSLRVSRKAMQEATKEAEKSTPSNYGTVEKAMKSAQTHMAIRHVIEEVMALWHGLQLIEKDPAKRIERWLGGLRRQALYEARQGAANATLTAGWIDMVDYLDRHSDSLTK